MPVRIVTDSSSDLTEAQASALGIEVVPLSIRFGDEEFVDRTELTVDEFYRRMAASEALPETSAPAPGAFEAAFRRCADAGADGIVCVNLSAQLSATMQSAQTAAKAFEDGVRVEVVDSQSVTLGLGSMVLWAAEQARDGADVDTHRRRRPRHDEPAAHLGHPRHPREPQEGRPRRRRQGDGGQPAVDQAGHLGPRGRRRGGGQAPHPGQGAALAGRPAARRTGRRPVVRGARPGAGHRRVRRADQRALRARRLHARHHRPRHRRPRRAPRDRRHVPGAAAS